MMELVKKRNQLDARIGLALSKDTLETLKSSGVDVPETIRQFLDLIATSLREGKRDDGRHEKGTRSKRRSTRTSL